MTVNLADAIRDAPIEAVRGDASLLVADATHDSRQVSSGCLFCCVRGRDIDGHTFAREAVTGGAVALLVDRPVDVVPSVPQVLTTDTRMAMAPIAAAIHHHPSRAIDVIGVTGTNGKTTTTILLHHAFGALGVSSALSGTLTGERTTPEATDLQRWLAAQRGRGVTAVAMEVSSHALDQHRVDATSFAVTVFTNLSPDHLDYHTSMDHYFAAKSRLFSPRFTSAAVVNGDDPYGRRLAEAIEREAGLVVHRYSLDLAHDLRVGGARSTFTWRGEAVTLTLGGRFNVSNALAAAESLLVLGHEPKDIAAALSVPVVVPGRFEAIEAGQPFTVIVDFAHTPDGLDQVLGAASDAVKPGARVRVVFGCGGDRDPAKRRLMGEIAARAADHVVLTADNSRSESTAAIIDAIKAGFDAATNPRATRFDVEPDRRAAIVLALDAAQEGDIVVLAGKGHETTQTIGGSVTPFDDREMARSALSHLGGWSP